jgi:hypothetical protein
MKMSRRYGTAVLATVALTVVMHAHPALAVPPSNDTEAEAVVVDAVPFTHSTDTREAAPGGPTFCSNTASAFYRFTPSESVRIQVDLLGSEYDTTLGVYTRDGEGHVKPLACSDDRLGYAAGVRLRAVRGTTYYFMVGECCQGGRSGGGPLTFTVTEVVTEPLEVTVDIGDSGVVDVGTGMATLSMTITCNKRSYISSSGTLRQLREELFVARGYLGVYQSCTPDAPLAVSIEVDTETSVVFGTGPATVRQSYVEGYAGWREWISDYEYVSVAVSLV